MDNVDELLERNRAFAGTDLKDRVPAIPFVPNRQLAIIHHTDCGSGFFADPEMRHGFAERGFDEKALAELPVMDPAETVRIDVERLAREPSISRRIKISGYSYDVKTGLLTAVVPARSR